MICMGVSTNHWFHSDQIYRTFFTLTMLCGCQGVNGGGWAHYVGQEKVRPLTGWQQTAFALDWQRPTRHMTGTSFFYLHTDQWRYESFGAGELSSPLGRGLFENRTFADCLAQASRLGWTPTHPAFDRNPLDLTDEAAEAGRPVADHIVDELRSGRLKWAGEDPDAPENWPRVMTIWRANVLGSSGKGMEYFMRHLLGTDDAVRAQESPEHLRPREVTWRDEAPRGKLDLLTTIDFRMTSSCTYSDIVLPAATWYEKHDLSSTDMHPFVHSFNPAIAPPWESRTDFDAFRLVAEDFSRLAAEHLGTRTDVIPVPLMHDSADETAQPGGRVLDWTAGECEPVPGVSMPKMVTIERDYAAVAEKMAALGPLVDTLGTSTKGITWKPLTVDYLRKANGVIRGGVGDGRPRWPGRASRRGDPGAVGHHQRPRRPPGLGGARKADRDEPRRPRGRALRRAHLLPRHAGAAARGHHQPGMVGQRDRRPPLLAVRRERRAQETLAHPHRPDALLPRPRLDPRVRRGDADLPAAARLRPPLR